MVLFEYRPYRLPFRVTVNTAHGPWREREGVLLRLTDEAGNSGVGEAAPIPWFGTETTDEVVTACRGLGTRIEGDVLATVPARLGCLRNALAAAERELARASAAQAGTPNSVASGGGHRVVAALLPAGRAALTEVGPKAEAGFRVFKWKVGVGAVDDELALLDDLCARLPDGSKLRLDANGAWDRRRAERWLTVCAERPVEFVEQPVAADARGVRDLLCGLAADFPTPVGLDESLIGDGDVETWIGARWTGVYVIKPSLLADPARALERLAKVGAAVVFSSALETAVGARAALHWAWAWTGETRALGFGVWPLFADARCDGPRAAPFLRWEDVERIDAEAAWNALD